MNQSKKLSKRGRNGEGRPAFYDDPAKLQVAVEKYFNDRDDVAEKENHRPHYTICGLALALGFSTRQSLSDYEGKAEFVDIIKRAKLKVENNYEESLRSTSPVGSIFALKNMTWRDKQELEHSGEKKITVEIIERYGEKPQKGDSGGSEQKTASQESA